MDKASPPATLSPSHPMGLKEFIGFIAATMALNAMAIDIMLPALGHVAEAFTLAADNDRQLVIVTYVMGFGIAQLVFGPLTDRYGRRGVLLWSMAGYLLFSLMSTLATDFDQLLIARFLQGCTVAGSRVVAASIVRDLYSGRQMASIMSMAMMVFMAIPILAPNIGTLVLLFAPWRWVFGLLAIYGAVMIVWAGLRLPETLRPENRSPIRPGVIARNYWRTVTTPVTAGYMAASGAVFGCLFGFITSAQQVFTDVYDVGETFTLYFAAIAGGMVISNFVNSRLVERVGMRRLSHGALIALLTVNLLHFALEHVIFMPVYAFTGLFAVSFALFGMLGANFNALAMEPMGKIAGTASAALGFVSTTISGFLGASIGMSYDGTAGPLILGFVVLSAAALLIVFVTEKGRLFQTH